MLVVLLQGREQVIGRPEKGAFLLWEELRCAGRAEDADQRDDDGSQWDHDELGQYLVFGLARVACVVGLDEDVDRDG